MQFQQHIYKSRQEYQHVQLKVGQNAELRAATGQLHLGDCSTRETVTLFGPTCTLQGLKRTAYGNRF